VYKLDPYPLEIYRMCENKLPMPKTFESYSITARECAHLVKRGHFRSRDKDGGHNIRSALVENFMLHVNRHGSML